MMNTIYFFDGTFVLAKDARIPVDDIGFQRGYGVFDALRTYNGTPYKLRAHIQRLLRSAKYAKIPHTYSYAQIERTALRVLEKNSFKNAVVKIIISGGIAPDMGLSGEKARLIVLIKKAPAPIARQYKKGAKAILFPVKRFAPHIKSLNYLSAVLGHMAAKRKSAAEAIYVEEGLVTEGTVSNLFIVKRNTLITPGEGMLRGITRATVLSLAKKFMPVTIGPIPVSQLFSADEVFLTGTTKEVLPIVNIDGKTIGSGRPGHYTNILRGQFIKTTE